MVQVLSYPMLDDRTVLRNDIDQRHLRLWDNRSNVFGWSSSTRACLPVTPSVPGSLTAGCRT